ncbi:uncharacterized protein V1516DRAFT_675838 [Lipomyces oligophaga]|uniref:uncharacterized protein n=1 Tax=Lipomyces oligophaga TaxID=45792 RepID=UPI0034CF4C01
MDLEPTAMAAHSSDKYLEKQIDIQEFLSVLLEVTISDGRQFSGQLVATDRDQNIILVNAEERLPLELADPKSDRPRYIGMIVVPGKHILRIDANKSSIETRHTLLYSNKSDRKNLVKDGAL